MDRITQDVTEPGFIQAPYPFYDRIRSEELIWWETYQMPMATSNKMVNALLKDRRFGRENPKPEPVPEHLAPFYAVEAHSMLELEPPRHTRLRGLVLRAFTSRRIKGFAPEIETLAHELVDQFPSGPFDLLPAFAQTIPVVIIARLLGVPEAHAPELLRWSNAMVGMYQAARTRAHEDAAVEATRAFTSFISDYIATKRNAPDDDLITHLIAAEEDGQRLTTEELITTCILLLNAGHEATVHSLGNGVKTCLESGLRPDDSPAFIEELLRFDPPLHIFTRYAMSDVEFAGHLFRTGDQVGLILGSANRDPSVYANPDIFDPNRAPLAHTSFGGGLHFCVGAPLARLELLIALRVLFARCPDLALTERPLYAPNYHFHGLSRLMVQLR